MLSNTNDSHRDSWPGIAGRLTLEIIATAVNDNRPPHDEMQFETFDTLVDRGNSVFRGGDVTKVTDVVFGITWSAVLYVVGVEVSTGRLAVRVSQVAELVNVEAVLARLEPGDFPRHSYKAIPLGEHNTAIDLIALSRCEYRDRFLGKRGEIIFLLFRSHMSRCSEQKCGQCRR